MNDKTAKPIDLSRFEYVPDPFVRTSNVLDLPGYAGGMKQSIHLNSVGMAEFIGSAHDLLAECKRQNGTILKLNGEIEAAETCIRETEAKNESQRETIKELTDALRTARSAFGSSYLRGQEISIANKSGSRAGAAGVEMREYANAGQKDVDAALAKVTA